MWPVVAAVVIGRILYLVIRDNSSTEEPKPVEKQVEAQPPPTIAELRNQLKKAVKEKKKRETAKSTSGASSDHKKPPVSPPKAPQTGSTTSGNGGR